MIYFMKVSILCRKMECGFGTQGYIFVSLKTKERKKSTFPCYFLVTLLTNLFLVQTQTPVIYSIIFKQVCHCLRHNGLLPKVWAVFENWRLSFWVSLCLYLKEASFSTKFTVLFYMPEFYCAERLKEKVLGWTFWQTEKLLLFAGGQMDKEVFERHRGDERAWTATGLSDPGWPAGLAYLD